jgi:hypothetical protein
VTKVEYKRNFFWHTQVGRDVKTGSSVENRSV